MVDFLAALGLVLVLEGLMYAGFPGLAKRAAASIGEAPETTMRMVGLICAVVGIAVIWAVRG